ncbi:hypothetical protein LXL04_028547 [Taraxacum kok-saghyz]
MRNLLLLTFSSPSPSYLLSSDAIISFLPSLLRRFVRTEEEPAKMMKPTGFFPRGSSRIAASSAPIVATEVGLHRRLTNPTTSGLMFTALSLITLSILKKGEWTVCSIHTSKKQKKSQQIHKKEEAICFLEPTPDGSPGSSLAPHRVGHGFETRGLQSGLATDGFRKRFPRLRLLQVVIDPAVPGEPVLNGNTL